MNPTLLTVMLQPAPTPVTGAHSEATGGGPGAAKGSMFGMETLFMFGAMALAMYFLLIRPEQKRQKETAALHGSLVKGSLVRTQGGILGEIVSVGAKDVTLNIARNVNINVLKSQIAGLEIPTKENTLEEAVNKTS